MEQIIEINYQRIKDEAADIVKRAWENDGREDSSEGTGGSKKKYDAMKDPIMVDPFHEI